MSDLQEEAKSINDPDLIVIGVGIPGESVSSVEGFKASYGLTDVEFWIDNGPHWQAIVPPGGRSFPIDLVVGRDGRIAYLENNYTPGAAMSAAQDALKKQ